MTFVAGVFFVVSVVGNNVVAVIVVVVAEGSGEPSPLVIPVSAG